MKHDSLDNELARKLKRDSFPETPNPWFTRRVLNKLPDKQPRSLLWLKVTVYATAFLGCLGMWTYATLFADHSVITVADVLFFFALVAVTVAVLWQGVKALAE